MLGRKFTCYERRTMAHRTGRPPKQPEMGLLSIGGAAKRAHRPSKICVSINEDYDTWTMSGHNKILSTQNGHQLEHGKRKT
jgi:hypothetical protein